jgi:hypothetical protein
LNPWAEWREDKDWQDAEAYRVYDAEEEHNRLRREIFAVICEEIARVQFTIDR